MHTTNSPRQITVVGMGYVGLPLALAFSTTFPVVGYDSDSVRIRELQNGVDQNREYQKDVLLGCAVDFTDDERCLVNAEFIVVTVPTPVDQDNDPDLGPLIAASESIGRQLRHRRSSSGPPTIVFESTTFPGCTEEVCGPAIERTSGLTAGSGFRLGYSPERTNFGDAEHGLGSVVKVVSGQDLATADLVESVYGLICTAGTWRTPDIRTAEAAKVIENVQRDLNIALFNELSVVFDRLGLSTSDVIEAASTKWNFVRFRPGLVGGHCIPVDPYYLTHKSREAGYEPQVILAGRRVNESMAEFIADKVIDLVQANAESPGGPNVLVLGLAFKANISDTRNSKIVNLVRQLKSRGASVSVFDPRVPGERFKENGLVAAPDPFKDSSTLDAIVLATPHREFTELSTTGLLRPLRDGGLLVDVTGALRQADVEEAGRAYWRP